MWLEKISGLCIFCIDKAVRAAKVCWSTTEIDMPGIIYHSVNLSTEAIALLKLSLVLAAPHMSKDEQRAALGLATRLNAFSERG